MTCTIPTWRVAVVLAAAIGAPAGAQPTYRGAFVPEGMIAMEKCKVPNENVAISSSRTVVRVLIPQDLADVGKRQVRYKVYRPAESPDQEDTDAYDSSLPNDSRTKEYQDNPFHVDLIGVDDAATPSALIKIKFVLLNHGLTFATVTPDTGAPIVGIAVQKATAFLCEAPVNPISRQNGHSTLTIYARRSVQEELPVNLVVMARSGKAQQTPILIDPKIKNNGN